MTYKVNIQQRGKNPDNAKLRLDLNGSTEDCNFIYQAVTFALGNTPKFQQFMIDTLTDEEDAAVSVPAMGFQ